MEKMSEKEIEKARGSAIKYMAAFAIASAFFYFYLKSPVIAFIFFVLLIMSLWYLLTLRSELDKQQREGARIRIRNENARRNEDGFSPANFGVFDWYDMEGDSRYGMFVPICGFPVFLWVRDDKILEERKRACTEIADNIPEVELAFRQYVDSREEFLYEKNLIRLEKIIFAFDDPKNGDARIIGPDASVEYSCSYESLKFSGFRRLLDI